MLRKVMEVRRVLLAAEVADREVVQLGADDANALYHVHIMIEGGFVRGYIVSGRFALVEGLTAEGHDLLDELRDEDRVCEAMDAAQGLGGYRENLLIVRAVLKRWREGGGRER